MKPLSVIYWSRVCLGITAAGICAVLGLVWDVSFLNGLSVGIIFYILTNYVLRRWFVSKGLEASKAFTTGIGAYFLFWIVSWVLLYSITHPAG